MTKLLQGKSLYIAKHMHNQALHADVDDHTDPRPITRLAPCVNIITDDGLLIDADYLNVHQRPPVSGMWVGEKIGFGSFMFHDIPGLLHDAYLEAGVHDPRGTKDTHISSFVELAKIHYAVVFVKLLLKLSWWFLHTFIAQGQFYSGELGATHAEYSYSLGCSSPAGGFGASVRVTWIGATHRSYAWGGYYCPKNTVMDVCEFVGIIPSVLTVHRDDLGIYHVW